jgi:catechol 2,3-dioxygenase-like lactoylglutathione lyase family enzyme
MTEDRAPDDPAQPVLAGVHHLKIAVSDLDTSIRWYERVLRAHRVERFDHRDTGGTLFGVILNLPGVDIPVELRLAPEAAAGTAGHDPITFGVADRTGLDRWVAHLDRHGVDRSPVVTGFIGHLVEFTSPDGLAIRIYTNPANGFADAEMSGAAEVGHTHTGEPGAAAGPVAGGSVLQRGPGRYRRQLVGRLVGAFEGAAAGVAVGGFGEAGEGGRPRRVDRAAGFVGEPEHRSDDRPPTIWQTQDLRLRTHQSSLRSDTARHHEFVTSPAARASRDRAATLGS